MRWIVNHRVRRVRDALEIRSLDRLQHRRPVVRQQNGTLVREHDLGWIILQIGDAGAFLFGRRETGLEFRQRSREIPSGGLGFDGVFVAAGLIGSDARQAHFGDVECPRRHRTAVAVDRDALREPQHAEHRRSLSALLKRERGAARELIAAQILGLRLIDDERAHRGLKFARPAAIVRSGAGSDCN